MSDGYGYSKVSDEQLNHVRRTLNDLKDRHLLPSDEFRNTALKLIAETLAKICDILER